MLFKQAAISPVELPQTLTFAYSSDVGKKAQIMKPEPPPWFLSVLQLAYRTEMNLLISLLVRVMTISPFLEV